MQAANFDPSSREITVVINNIQPVAFEEKATLYHISGDNPEAENSLENPQNVSLGRGTQASDYRMIVGGGHDNVSPAVRDCQRKIILPAETDHNYTITLAVECIRVNQIKSMLNKKKTVNNTAGKLVENFADLL